MDSPLTPDLALAYLRELSVDVKSAIVVDGEGRRLAGPPELLNPARAVLGVMAATSGLAIRTTAGWVFAARSPSVGLVVATGPLALRGLVLHDVRDIVALLGGGAHDETPGDTREAPSDALRALGEAVQRAVAPSRDAVVGRPIVRSLRRSARPADRRRPGPVLLSPPFMSPTRRSP